MEQSPATDAEKPQGDGSEYRHQADTQDEDEKPPPTRGYAHLAEFMTKTHHGMMRRFKDLSTLNLLYLQAELYQLKYELDRETAKDMRCPVNDERQGWDYHWRLLATSGLRTDGKRWKIWLRLREKLYEYPGPTNDQRRVLAKIVGRDSISDGTFAFFSPELMGLEPEVYREEFLDDLVLLEAAVEENDPLERFGVRSVLRLFRALGGSSSAGLVFADRPTSTKKLIQQEDIESGLGGNLTIVDGKVYQYSKRTYSAANRIIGAMSSAVVPMASILTLYAIRNPNVRVGLVCVFALVFCLLLSLLTKARRIEIFAATAA
ncbi:hypothetical protein SLS53_008812 [Cytospora paraplurivora]|uniref:DUF6594 domain-containing protein n=1 Tax=Cytospora paraplurivora TaxID=2898453 RepID=A0AAN9TZH1_9PEZI